MDINPLCDVILMGVILFSILLLLSIYIIYHLIKLMSDKNREIQRLTDIMLDVRIICQTEIKRSKEQNIKYSCSITEILKKVENL